MLQSLTPTGAEQGNLSSLNDKGLQHYSNSGGAESGAFSLKKSKLDPFLVHLFNTWSELPEHIKAAIKALVKTQVQGDLQ